jgi:hypothetical protein
MMVIQTPGGSSYETYTDGTGTEYETASVTIPNPDYAPGETRPAVQGADLGAAVFRRLEGACRRRRACTAPGWWCRDLSWRADHRPS